MNEQLYLVRTVGDHFYFKGSGMFAVPKLYKTGDAKRVVRKENKFREGVNNNPAYKDRVKYTLVEAVAVTFVLGETTQFKE